MRISELVKPKQTKSTAARHRSVQRRETELDPNKPIKPVVVAEPTKPKKPKYKGKRAS